MLLDILGHPIEEGMTVLTNAHNSPAMTELSVVEKVTGKAVYVSVYAHTGYWDVNTNRHVSTSGNKQIRRRPDQVIVIDKQLSYNKKTYPEYQI